MKFFKAPLLLVLPMICVAWQPAYADPPPWAPAHGKRAKQIPYTYYPEYGIYYAPESKAWFWLEGSDWRVGATLPVDLRPFAAGGGVSIELETDKPYRQQDLVETRYGKPKKLKKSHKD